MRGCILCNYQQLVRHAPSLRPRTPVSGGHSGLVGDLVRRRLWHVSEASPDTSENVTTHVAACVVFDRTSGGTIFCLATRIRPPVWLVFWTDVRGLPGPPIVYHC